MSSLKGKTQVKRINNNYIENAEKLGLEINEYIGKLEKDNENNQKDIAHVELVKLTTELEKVKQVPAIIDSLIEMRKADRRFLDEVEREHRKDRESVSALTKAVSNMTDLFIKALTRRG